MKKIVIAILCLFLVACGTFNVKVQVLPDASATAPAVEATTPALPSTTVLPAASATTAVTGTTTATAGPTFTQTIVAAGRITLLDIQMSDTRRGWGVEKAGRIVKTSDGGGFWKDVTPLGASFERHSLCALTIDTAWAVPAQFEASNVVWRTQDGGTTWEVSQPIAIGLGKYIPLSLQCPDATHGWLLVRAEDLERGRHLMLYSTADGGENWTPDTSINAFVDPSPYLPPTVSSMAFFDGKHGWIGGGWDSEHPNKWTMLKTTNGGLKWGTDELRLPSQSGIQCQGHPIPEMASGSMAVDITCTLPKDAKYLFHRLYYLSTRGEPEWTSLALPGEFVSVGFLNARQGWMIVTPDNAQLNQLLYTLDGGRNWQKINDVTWKEAQFDFVTNKTGWAIVGDGFSKWLMRTENGGRVWIQVRPVLGE